MRHPALASTDVPSSRLKLSLVFFFWRGLLDVGSSYGAFCGRGMCVVALDPRAAARCRNSSHASINKSPDASISKRKVLTETAFKPLSSSQRLLSSNSLPKPNAKFVDPKPDPRPEAMYPRLRRLEWSLPTPENLERLLASTQKERRFSAMGGRPSGQGFPGSPSQAERETKSRGGPGSGTSGGPGR